MTTYHPNSLFAPTLPSAATRRLLSPRVRRAVAALAVFSLAITPSYAQGAAGGGGEPKPGQSFSTDPRFSTPLFTKRGSELTVAERRHRDDLWRNEIRKQLFVPAALPPLDAKVWSTFSPMPGVLADRVTYRTADGMLVPAIVYRPDPRTGKVHRRLPGAVVINGHGGDKFRWDAFYSGMLVARAGAAAVTS